MDVGAQMEKRYSIRVKAGRRRTTWRRIRGWLSLSASGRGDGTNAASSGTMWNRTAAGARRGAACAAGIDADQVNVVGLYVSRTLPRRYRGTEALPAIPPVPSKTATSMT